MRVADASIRDAIGRWDAKYLSERRAAELGESLSSYELFDFFLDPRGEHRAEDDRLHNYMTSDDEDDDEEEEESPRRAARREDRICRAQAVCGILVEGYGANIFTLDAFGRSGLLAVVEAGARVWDPTMARVWAWFAERMVSLFERCAQGSAADALRVEERVRRQAALTIATAAEARTLWDATMRLLPTASAREEEAPWLLCALFFPGLASEDIGGPLRALLRENPRAAFAVRRGHRRWSSAGFTLLHAAVGSMEHGLVWSDPWLRAEHTAEIARLLLEADADPLATDASGRTPLDVWAQTWRRGQPELEATPVFQLLTAACERSSARLLAVAMAFHPRLGAGAAPLVVDAVRSWACGGPTWVDGSAARLRRALRCVFALTHRGESRGAWFLRRLETDIVGFIRLYRFCVRNRVPVTRRLLREFRFRAWLAASSARCGRLTTLMYEVSDRMEHFAAATHLAQLPARNGYCALARQIMWHRRWRAARHFNK